MTDILSIISLGCVVLFIAIILVSIYKINTNNWKSVVIGGIVILASIAMILVNINNLFQLANL